MQNGIHGSRSSSKDPISKWNSIWNKEDTNSYHLKNKFLISYEVQQVDTYNNKQIDKKNHRKYLQHSTFQHYLWAELNRTFD
jgi:hypothetical protein